MTACCALIRCIDVSNGVHICSPLDYLMQTADSWTSIPDDALDASSLLLGVPPPNNDDGENAYFVTEHGMVDEQSLANDVDGCGTTSVHEDVTLTLELLPDESGTCKVILSVHKVCRLLCMTIHQCKTQETGALSLCEYWPKQMIFTSPIKESCSEGSV